MKIQSLFFVFICCLNGCSNTSNPAYPPEEESSLSNISWNTSLGTADGWNAGNWEWSLVSGDSYSGVAKLEISPLAEPLKGWNIQWEFFPALPDSQEQNSLVLTPLNQEKWHCMKGFGPHESSMIPLPRIPIDSTLYPDLLHLIKELTTPYFQQRVTHWPEYPIPVRLVPAINGPIDMAECLSEATERWNEGADSPWFIIDSTASWGIRLVFFPDREMHPPLAAQITRLDGDGRPLRINLLAGNNYHSLLSRPYVVRGFVHELGHALFLWGHSLDRIHCLWGLAPPMVSDPSADERKAARWWHGLPDGLDLSRYGDSALSSINLQ